MATLLSRFRVAERLAFLALACCALASFDAAAHRGHPARERAETDGVEEIVYRAGPTAQNRAQPAEVMERAERVRPAVVQESSLPCPGPGGTCDCASRACAGTSKVAHVAAARLAPPIGRIADRRTALPALPMPMQQSLLSALAPRAPPLAS